MGVPDWMITVDSRKTKILHNGACIQYLVHFKGKFIIKCFFLIYIKYYLIICFN